MTNSFEVNQRDSFIRQLTIQRVMLVIIFAMLFSLATRIPIDTDTWWHLRSGEHTLTEGMIYEDPFSHTKLGETWINHSWGSQIVMFGVWELLGNVGLALYVSVLATAGMGMLYMMSEGSVYLRSFALILGASTAAVFWSPRPQMMSFFFSTVLLYILFLYKRKKVDRLWFIPPLMLLWGNMHAGFSIAYILIGGVVAGEIMGNLFTRDNENLILVKGIRKLIVVSLVSVAALVVNPYGFRMLLVPFETVSIGALREFIQEWNSPNFQQRQTWPFVFLIVAIIGAAGASRKRLDWTDFILVSGTMFMGLLAGRNIAVFAVTATPVLTYHLNDILQERGWVVKPVRRMSLVQGWLNLVIVVVVLIGVLFSIVAVLTPETVDTAQRQFLPVQVAEYIEAEQPPGPIFNSYNWGGYLMFAVPDYPVYVDGRTDLYKNEFLLRYLQTVLAIDDWRDVLDEDGINMVVIESNSALARRLAEEADWRQVYPNDEYEDEKAVIYVRNENH